MGNLSITGKIRAGDHDGDYDIAPWSRHNGGLLRKLLFLFAAFFRQSCQQLNVPLDLRVAAGAHQIDLCSELRFFA
jgi:hypothetical protein